MNVYLSVRIKKKKQDKNKINVTFFFINMARIIDLDHFPLEAVKIT